VAEWVLICPHLRPPKTQAGGHKHRRAILHALIAALK
jgi:hypothetical protein